MSDAADPRALYLDKTHPQVWQALQEMMDRVKEAARAAGIPDTALELLFIRVSQINGCAYCLDKHVKMGRRAGITDRQLAVLPAWRDSALFDEIEQAALLVGEMTTRLPEHDQRLETQEAALACLSSEQLTALEWAAIGMNSTNRVSILSGHPVEERTLDRRAREQARTHSPEA